MQRRKRARAPPTTPVEAPSGHPTLLLALFLFLPLLFFLAASNQGFIIGATPVPPTPPLAPLPAALFPPAPPPPDADALNRAHRAAVSTVATQCGGQDFSSGMPIHTQWAPGAGGCAGGAATLAAALRLAARGPPPIPWASRSEGDGAPDGELALPAGGACELRWYDPARACAALARAGGALLVGDSLARQLTQGLALILSGNFAVGSLLAAGTAPFAEPAAAVWARCSCDATFGKWFGCHNQPLAAGDDFRAVCPAWRLGAPGGLMYKAWWGTGESTGDDGGRIDSKPGFHADVRAALANFSASARAAAGANATPPALVVEVGPAWYQPGRPGEVWEAGSPAIAEFVRAMAAAAAASGARLVCFLAPAPDEARKPPHVLPQQGDAAYRAINEWVAGLCGAERALVLDGYALTKGAWSRDGTHYEGRVNAMMAQALLNLMELP
jgi:hypothetical protein